MATDADAGAGTTTDRATEAGAMEIDGVVTTVGARVTYTGAGAAAYVDGAIGMTYGS